MLVDETPAGGETPEQQQQQQQEQLEGHGIACPTHATSDVVRRIWIGVKRVCSLPLVGPAKGLLEASSLSVVAAWLPERFRLVLPTLPGIDPLLCLFVCVDGEPYAQLRQPFDLLQVEPRRGGLPSLAVPFASSFGFLEVSLKADPIRGLFLSSKEFKKLNLKSEGQSEVDLRTRICTNNPDFYGAPVVGRYGQWTVFLNDVEAEDGSESDDNKGDDDWEGEDRGSSEAAAAAAAAASSSAGPALLPFAACIFGGTTKAGAATAAAAAAAATTGTTFFSPALPRAPRNPPQQKPHRRGFLEILEEIEEEERQKKAAKEVEMADARATAAAAAAAAGEGRHQSPRGLGPVVADMCVAEGPGLKGGIVGEWCCFSLRLKNRKGETVTETEGTVRVLLEALGHIHFQVSAQQQQLRWETREDPRGGLTVRYRYDYPGRFRLHVNYDGLPVAGAPFEVTLISGAPCPLATKVVGRGSRICFASPSATEAQAGHSIKEIEETQNDEERGDSSLNKKEKTPEYTHFVNHFKVIVCDAHGNRVPIGGHCVTVRASGGAHVLRVRDEGDGSYTVSYVMRASSCLLLKASLHHLRLADAVANLLTYEQRLASDELVQQTKEQLRQGKHDEAARTLECVYGASKSEQGLRFRLRKEAEEALERISLRDVLHQSLDLQGGDSDEETPEGCLEMTQKEKTEKELCKLKDLQQQWEEVQAVRELLLKLSKDAERQQHVMHAFTEAMLLTLQRTQTRNLRLLAEKNDVMRLRDENLVPLAEVLQMQYFHMFTTMTKQIVSYVSSLRDRDFFNLEELLDTYKRIGEELRLLHRYALADLFDELSLCVCEEIELQRLEHVYTERQRTCADLEKAIEEKENQLKDVKLRHDAKFRNVEPLDLEEVAEICITKEQKSIQTEDALSLREGVLGPLIVSRATGQRAEAPDPVCALAKLHWRTCNPYEMHTSIRKLLKSTPRFEDCCLPPAAAVCLPLLLAASRLLLSPAAAAAPSADAVWLAAALSVVKVLKLCLQEIFAYYSKAPREAVVQRWQSLEGLPVGLTQPAFMRFCWDLKLQENLLTDPTQLACFFEKFSVEPDEGLIRPEGFLRVLPLFLWLPCVRELAYLNLVHSLSAEVLSSGLDPSSSALKSSHPSRLVAFHHFCTFHLVPLYEYLYNSQDFRLSNVPLITQTKDEADTSSSSTTAAAAAAAAASASSVEVIADLASYSRQQLPGDILSMLRLEPLEHLFAFYSELSRHPARHHSRGTAAAAVASGVSAPPAGGAATAGAAATAGQQREPGTRLSNPRSALLRPPRGAQEAIGTSDAKVSPFSSKEVTAAEAAAPSAASDGWISVGVFVRMLRELGILPGFLSLDAAKTIALVSSSSPHKQEQQQQQQQQEQQQQEEENKEQQDTIEYKVLFIPLESFLIKPVHEVGPNDPSSPSAAARGAHPRAAAAASAAAPSICCSVTRIREEARQLLDVFGLLSLPCVLALTTRARG
ncbi:hypothetical protein ACSSS7_003930 [Eimeria intestinalis]